MKKDLYIEKLKTFLLFELKDSGIKIYLFGSWARGESMIGSDVDIGLYGHMSLTSEVSTLREKVEQLNIPYKVDLVDLRDVSEDFRNKVLKECIVWKEN